MVQSERSELGRWRTSESRASIARPVSRTLPPQLVLGLLLVAVAWPLAWVGPAPFSAYTFFPLWLGYILTVDGIVERRCGSSILTRSPARFALLFAFSIPLWWLFEGVNRFIGNWRYVMPYDHGFLLNTLLSSLAFSTVIPALFETAELYRSVAFFRRPRHWLRIAPGRRALVAIAVAGVAMSAFALLAPRYGFPFVWLGVYFVLDPLLALAGKPSLAAQVARGRWDTVLVLFAAGLTCGLFWETWNYWSMPKWEYDIPFFARAKLFEMPLLGYGGYFPFALEVYVVYQTCRALVGLDDSAIRFDDVGES